MVRGWPLIQPLLLSKIEDLHPRTNSLYSLSPWMSWVHPPSLPRSQAFLPTHPPIHPPISTPLLPGNRQEVYYKVAKIAKDDVIMAHFFKTWVKRCTDDAKFSFQIHRHIQKTQTNERNAHTHSVCNVAQNSPWPCLTYRVDYLRLLYMVLLVNLYASCSCREEGACML